RARTFSRNASVLRYQASAPKRTRKTAATASRRLTQRLFFLVAGGRAARVSAEVVMAWLQRPAEAARSASSLYVPARAGSSASYSEARQCAAQSGPARFCRRLLPA